MALNSIKPPRRRLADEVYNQLINAIVDKDIGADDKLIQEKLAAELNISRTPVREALLRLEKEGVLRVTSNGNFQLATIDKAQILELYQARTAIEGQAARILAVYGTKAKFNKLRDVIMRQEHTPVRNMRDYFVANRKIHRTFMEMAGNGYLLEMFDMIWGRAMVFHLFAANVEATDVIGLSGHQELVDVFETGDKTAALEKVTQHIQAGYDLFVRGTCHESEK